MPEVTDYKGVVDGTGSKGEGLPIDCIPPQSLWVLAQVFEHGATKYAKHNWMKGIAWSKGYSALQRHLQRWYAGEWLDPDSKLPHLAHAMWHCCTLLFWGLKPEYDQFDDRPFKQREAL